MNNKAKSIVASAESYYIFCYTPYGGDADSEWYADDDELSLGAILRRVPYPLSLAKTGMASFDRFCNYVSTAYGAINPYALLETIEGKFVSYLTSRKVGQKLLAQSGKITALDCAYIKNGDLVIDFRADAFLAKPITSLFVPFLQKFCKSANCVLKYGSTKYEAGCPSFRLSIGVEEYTEMTGYDSKPVLLAADAISAGMPIKPFLSTIRRNCAAIEKDFLRKNNVTIARAAFPELAFRVVQNVAYKLFNLKIHEPIYKAGASGGYNVTIDVQRKGARAKSVAEAIARNFGEEYEIIPMDYVYRVKLISHFEPWLARYQSEIVQPYPSAETLQSVFAGR